MKRILVIGLAMATVGALTAILGLVLLGCVDTKTITEPEAPTFKPTPTSALVTVYQSITCGCCGEYVPYLRNEGFQVEVVYVEDTTALRGKYPVPPELRSCHIAVVEDYFVEGHVPSEAILTLLAQKPAIDGIILPGMPSGSPGMGGPKIGAFIIYALSDGVVSEFLTLP